jgi:hypothetical protein
MLQNSPKRICDFKTFSGGYTRRPGPSLKREGNEREIRGGEVPGGEERRGGEVGEVSYPLLLEAKLRLCLYA